MSCWLEKTLLPRTTHKKEIAARYGVCFTVTGIMKYTEKKCVSKIGSLQILTSEKYTLPLKEWMAASILRNNYRT